MSMLGVKMLIVYDVYIMVAFQHGMQDAINQIHSQITFDQNLHIANKKGVYSRCFFCHFCSLYTSYILKAYRRG
jgi:hypothetical protein